MNINMNPENLRAMADKEDGRILSVGGFLNEVIEPPTEAAPAVITVVPKPEDTRYYLRLYAAKEEGAEVPEQLWGTDFTLQSRTDEEALSRAAELIGEYESQFDSLEPAARPSPVDRVLFYESGTRYFHRIDYEAWALAGQTIE